MQAKDILTTHVAYCTPETPLRAVAEMMVDYDCGAIPVVRAQEDLQVVGIVTDRDITCRAVAEGINPLYLRAQDVLSAPIITASPESSIEECVSLMEMYKVRRLPITNANGVLLGMISQTDLVQIGPPEEAAALVQTISLPTASASYIPSNSGMVYDT